MHNPPRYFTDNRCWRDAMIATGVTVPVTICVSLLPDAMRIAVTFPVFLALVLASFAAGTLVSAWMIRNMDMKRASILPASAAQTSYTTQAYVPPPTTYAQPSYVPPSYAPILTIPSIPSAPSVPSVPSAPSFPSFPAFISARPFVRAIAPATVYPATAPTPLTQTKTPHVKPGRIRHEDATTYES